MDGDPRIPLRFGGMAQAGAGAALLIEAAEGTPLPASPAGIARFVLPATAHLPGCACCLPRGPVAVALGRLFLARARGEVPFFDTVVAVVQGEAGAKAVRAALQDDVVTRARFRLADQP